MADETENLVNKLKEIEAQAALGLREVPPGLTRSRLRHMLTLARVIRVRLEGQSVAPIEPLPEELAKGVRQH